MSTTVTLEKAKKMAEGAMAKARELKISISVAVVDGGGHLKLLYRMENIGFFTAKMAEVKANSAIAFQRDTELLEERFAHRQLLAGAFTPISQGTVVVSMGGVLVRHADEIIGAVGVSGGTGEQDVECARAGAACFQ